MDASKIIPPAKISILATFFFISALFERLAIVNESPGLHAHILAQIREGVHVSVRIWRESVSERKVNPSPREKLQRLPAARQIKTIVFSFQLHEKRRKKKLARRACSSPGVNQIGACDFLTNCAILLRHEKIKKERQTRRRCHLGHPRGPGKIPDRRVRGRGDRADREFHICKHGRNEALGAGEKLGLYLHAIRKPHAYYRREEARSAGRRGSSCGHCVRHGRHFERSSFCAEGR